MYHALHCFIVEVLDMLGDVAVLQVTFHSNAGPRGRGGKHQFLRICRGSVKTAKPEGVDVKPAPGR